MDMEKHIEIYNELTHKENDIESDNFLSSIKYKMCNGNNLVKSLLKITENGISFKVKVGYDKENLSSEINEFRTCTIDTNSDISTINELVSTEGVECTNSENYIKLTIK